MKLHYPLLLCEWQGPIDTFSMGEFLWLPFLLVEVFQNESPSLASDRQVSNFSLIKGEIERAWRISPNLLHSLKLTYPFKMVVSNRNLLFQGSIFRGYVSFREGICIFSTCSTGFLYPNNPSQHPNPTKTLSFLLVTLWRHQLGQQLVETSPQVMVTAGPGHGTPESSSQVWLVFSFPSTNF